MEKRKKPQGKLNAKKVLAGIIAGDKKKDIAPKAGSIAKSDVAKVNSVNRVMKRDDYKKDAKNVVDVFDSIIKNGLTELDAKDAKWVNFKDLTGSMEKLVKLRELLTGGVTERTEIAPSEVQEYLKQA